MRVLIADDHSLLRQGLIELLRSGEPDWSFSEAASFDEALESLVAGVPDLLVMDLRMPGMEGGESLRALREAYPELKLVVLTAVDERAMILDCLSAGVHGYILKSSATDQILLAVRNILAGGVYVPQALTRVVASSDGPRPAVSQPPRAAAGNTHSFTSRQMEVLNLLAEGRSTKDIARALNLGVGTVKVHLSAIYRILGAHNRMEAVVRAGALRG